MNKINMKTYLHFYAFILFLLLRHGIFVSGNYFDAGIQSRLLDGDLMAVDCNYNFLEFQLQSHLAEIRHKHL